MFVQFRSATDSDGSSGLENHNSGLENVTNNLMNPTLCAGFPNLVQLVALSHVLPVTTATIERTMKLKQLRRRH